MLHTLLQLTRPFFLIDTETTGTDPREDRIVEISFQRWEPEVGMTLEWCSRVNPGIPIPLESSKVHGIYDLDIARCQRCDLVRDDVAPDRCRCDQPKIVPYFKQIAPNLAAGLVGCDFGGQSVKFDLQITAAEMHRAGVAWSWLGARVIDTYRLEALAVPRGLSDLHEKYVGTKHEGAHGALSDVRASATVMLQQLMAHEGLPRDLDLLHRAQWGVDEQLDGEGKFRMVNGVPTCAFGKRYKGVAMKDIDKSFWNWILSSDFPADVKALAAEAKNGRFPEVK